MIDLDLDPVKFLICPDSFKGSLTAAAAAQAIARGIRQGHAIAQIQCLPLADGGEGTVEALIMALGGERRYHWVTGPLGDPVRASFGLLAAGRIAVVELAQASGLPLVPDSRRDPLSATTLGTGELILAACETGAEQIWIGIGGSATTDGGAGIAKALGFELLDAAGDPIGLGGGELLRLAQIRGTGRSASISGRRFRVICDVTNPLIGPQGAAAIYGPQKGATPQQVQILDRALAHFAQIVARDLGVEMADRAGAGAAGGAGGGLVAFLGACLEPGIEVISEQLQLQHQIQGCDWVITGEGQVDRQSLNGKVISGVIRSAASLNKPVILLAGRIDPQVRPHLQAQGIQAYELLSLTPNPQIAMAQAAEYLQRLAAQIVGSWGKTVS